MCTASFLPLPLSVRSLYATQPTAYPGLLYAVPFFWGRHRAFAWTHSFHAFPNANDIPASNFCDIARWSLLLCVDVVRVRSHLDIERPSLLLKTWAMTSLSGRWPGCRVWYRPCSSGLWTDGSTKSAQLILMDHWHWLLSQKAACFEMLEPFHGVRRLDNDYVTWDGRIQLLGQASQALLWKRYLRPIPSDQTGHHPCLIKGWRRGADSSPSNTLEGPACFSARPPAVKSPLQQRNPQPNTVLDLCHEAGSSSKVWRLTLESGHVAKVTGWCSLYFDRKSFILNLSEWFVIYIIK